MKLPLAISEASAWLARGHDVEILCEAIPWPSEPPAGDRVAASKRRRSFSVYSGSMPARVIVTLAASFAGACPNLRGDSGCAIYEERPRVCRVYPAEISPFVAFDRAAKACTQDAWAAREFSHLAAGVLVDDKTRSLIGQALAANESDVQGKAHVCKALGIRATAMANEGFVVHSVERLLLAEVLSELRGIALAPQETQMDWRFVSKNSTTLAAFAEIGASAAMPIGEDFEFLDFAKC